MRFPLSLAGEYAVLTSHGFAAAVLRAALFIKNVQAAVNVIYVTALPASAAQL
jgi:hypothetical protein